METNDQASIFVRIREIPPVKMVRSGKGDLEAFDKWWSAIDPALMNKLSPQDFMWFNPELGDLEWLLVQPEGLSDTGGYEVFDFPGGLYAVAACKDEGAEIERTSKLINQWIEASEVFDIAPESSGLYEMGHIITPKNAKETLGYHQMDVFVPIVVKKGA